MATVDQIPKTYEEAVRTLVGWHADDHAIEDLEIYSFDDPRKMHVRLLEISNWFPQTERPYPFTFGESDLFPFKSTVIQIPPAQWAEVKEGKFALPTGWNLDARRKVWT